ncbi:MAG: dihydropteroate synthase [Deltaproteobacteria bacterium]|nr:dihydropteroate synthase [Deltaproteobacteria bacterium]
MSILNVTPDSFFDGGHHAEVDAAVRRAWEVVDEGADVLDLGGESTRPGAAPVSLDEELRRTVPVVERLVKEDYPLPISIDTSRHTVARRTLEAGAVIVNDVTGGTREPEILAVAAEHGAAVVLMHMRGTPQTMQGQTDYRDVVSEVSEALRALCDAATAAGIPAERQAVDPGIGFAKTATDSLRLVSEVGHFEQLARPVLLGASRKSFLGRLFGQEGDDRLYGSLAVAAWSALRGAHILRVHDVRATRAVLNVTMALSDTEGGLSDRPT